MTSIDAQTSQKPKLTLGLAATKTFLSHLRWCGTVKEETDLEET